MSTDKTNITVSPLGINYLESNNNNKLKETLPSYDEVVNSSEFNDIIRAHRYARIQYIVPQISQRNDHPPIFTTTQHQDTESLYEESRNQKIKTKLFIISIFLIIMIPAVFILVVIVTNITAS
uniref:Uncharacterized protein n=1 Tax=Strongyloides stercoralis TaxID=6248 RepID=A0A0K0EEG8_STRER